MVSQTAFPDREIGQCDLRLVAVSDLTFATATPSADRRVALLPIGIDNCGVVIAGQTSLAAALEQACSHVVAYVVDGPHIAVAELQREWEQSLVLYDVSMAQQARFARQLLRPLYEGRKRLRSVTAAAAPGVVLPAWVAGKVGTWRDFVASRLAVGYRQLENYSKLMTAAEVPGIDADTRALLLEEHDNPKFLPAQRGRSRRHQATAVALTADGAAAEAAHQNMSRVIDGITLAESALLTADMSALAQSISADPVNFEDWEATVAGAYRLLSLVDTVAEIVRGPRAVAV